MDIEVRFHSSHIALLLVLPCLVLCFLCVFLVGSETELKTKWGK